MWTHEVTTVVREFQPGKALPVPKHAFVKDDGTRIDLVGAQERGFLRFGYKGQGIEYVMMGRLIRPAPPTGDLTFALEPFPYEPTSRAVAAGRLRPEDVAKIPGTTPDLSVVATQPAACGWHAGQGRYERCGSISSRTMIPANAADGAGYRRITSGSCPGTM